MIIGQKTVRAFTVHHAGGGADIELAQLCVGDLPRASIVTHSERDGLTEMDGDFRLRRAVCLYNAARDWSQSAGRTALLTLLAEQEPELARIIRPALDMLGAAQAAAREAIEQERGR